MPTRCTARPNHPVSTLAMNRPIKKIASAATIRPLQSSIRAPTTCGSSQPESAARKSSIGRNCRGIAEPAQAKARRCGILAGMKRFPLWLALALAVTGCATAPASGGGDTQVEIDSHSLLGEIAFERQQFDTAASEFLAAAMLSEQPALAERATRIAHQLELTEPGLRAATRWKQLAPEDERPFWFAGVFETRSNRLAKATTEFESFIRALGDPATGFALVLEALADEPYTDAATAIMRSLVQTFPGVPAGQYALARLALRSGDFDLALENAKAASDSDPNWLEAQMLYARSLLVAGKTDESLSLAAKLAAAAHRGRGAAAVRRAAPVRGQAARSRDAAQRDPHDQSRPARGDARARVPRAHGAAPRRGEGEVRRAARRSALSRRSVLLPRPHRRDREGLPERHALVRARDRRHARGRGAAAHRAHHVRGAERPRGRGASLARLRRRESAVRVEHARRAEPAAAADAAARRGDEAVRRSARRDARRPDAARGARPALRAARAERRGAPRARRGREAARRGARALSGRRRAALLAGAALRGPRPQQEGRRRAREPRRRQPGRSRAA